MEQRYDVAGCLLQGKVYSEIRQLTGASSATVSRVNRMLNYGTGAVAKASAMTLLHSRTAKILKEELQNEHSNQ